MNRAPLSGFLALGMLLLGLGSALPVAAAVGAPPADELLWYQDSQGLGQIQFDTTGAIDPITGGYRVNVRIIRNCQIASGTGCEIPLRHLLRSKSGSNDYLLLFTLQDFSGLTLQFQGRLTREETADGTRVRAQGEFQPLGGDGDPVAWIASADLSDMPASADAAPGDTPP